MEIPSKSTSPPQPGHMPIVALDVPVIYEDEGQDEMGETDPHFESIAVLRYGLKAHLAGQTDYRVFSDLNVYYHPLDTNAYVSPDDMVVQPTRDLGEHVTSYCVGRDGPAPILTVEVLSRRSSQQQDTTNKPDIYAFMKVAEYVLVDVTGEFLEQRLLIKRLQTSGVWTDDQDADGGITSQLGFRLTIDIDGQLHVVDSQTGDCYARPDEAQQHQQARRLAEQQVEHLQAELQRLRQQISPGEGASEKQ